MDTPGTDAYWVRNNKSLVLSNTSYSVLYQTCVGLTSVRCDLQVARKLVIIESDLERTEERAELSEK